MKSNPVYENRNSLTDWTDHYDPEVAIDLANKLIDKIILEIAKKNMHIYNKLDLKEIALLVREPVFTAVNIFMERLLRVLYQINSGVEVVYPNVQGRRRYFQNTREAILNYYHDPFINHSLLNDVKAVLKDRSNISAEDGIILPRPQDELLIEKEPFSLRSFAKKALRLIKIVVQYSEDAYVKITKPEVVGEGSFWMQQLFPFTNLMRFDCHWNGQEQDEALRSQLRECCTRAFLAWEERPLAVLPQSQKKKLAEIFSVFIDHILPTSIIEGFEERFTHYESLVNGWSIKQVHSFTGYAWNENFKIFAILAKRKGARLVYHMHGGGDFSPQPRLIHNEFQFLDYCFMWPKGDCDWMKGREEIHGRKLDQLKLVGLGSPYLSSIKRVGNKRIDPKKIRILYPSSPLWQFSPILEGLSPEKQYRHRINVLRFLKEISRIYPGAEIIYKPLWTFANDPIKYQFAAELKDGSVKVVRVPPASLFDKIDIVLWDSISTGFAEALQREVPTLVFHNRAIYERSLPFGQRIYDELRKSGVVFYDITSGIEAFNRIIDHTSEYFQGRKGAIEKFREARAYAVPKEEYLRKMKEILVKG